MVDCILTEFDEMTREKIKSERTDQKQERSMRQD